MPDLSSLLGIVGGAVLAIYLYDGSFVSIARLPRGEIAARARVQALVCDSIHYFLATRVRRNVCRHRCVPTKSKPATGRCS